MASRSQPTTEISPIPPPQPPRQHLKVHLDTPIFELESCYGQNHPHYPKTVRQYYELNSNQLDHLLAFFHQTYPPTAETTSERYPTTISPLLGHNGRAYSLNVEYKRSLFGKFIGLKNDLVDYKINPLKYQEVYDKQAITEAIRPSGKASSGTGPSGAVMTGAGTFSASTVQRRDKKRRDKRKGFFARFRFGK
ncbi:hypothetical protein N7445_005497 [Penicillium cf. griseofulvum]|nr:hypothetical protein N7445_005497 [Penicillium cf. griseofulvum]